MKHFSLVFLIIILLCLSVTFGCGSNQPKGLPKLTASELTIQYDDGSPIENAIVMLYPVDGKWYSNGITDSNGLVKVAVNGSFPGAVPGDYKVTVQKQDVEMPPGYDPEKDSDNAPEALITDYIANEFGSLSKTPLQITIGASKFNETLTVKKPEQKKKQK